MKLTKIFDNLYVKMDKARATHKYYKRVPKPTGKGYIYYYTKADYDKSKREDKPGKVTNKGGLLAGVMSFFGFKDDKQAKDKVAEIYNTNKSELSGIDKSTFSDYLNEYLSNKEKWDKKFQGKEKKVIGTKDGKKVVKKPAGEKKAPGKKGFSLSIMKKVAGVVGGVGEDITGKEALDRLRPKKISEGAKSDPSLDIKGMSDKGIKDLKDMSEKLIKRHEELKKDPKKKKVSEEKIEIAKDVLKRIKEERMPEGEGEIQDEKTKRFIDKEIKDVEDKGGKVHEIDINGKKYYIEVDPTYGWKGRGKDATIRNPDWTVISTQQGRGNLSKNELEKMAKQIVDKKLEKPLDKREIMSHEGENGDIYSSSTLKKKDGSYKNTIPHKGIKKNNIKDPLEKKLFNTIKVSNRINDSMSKIKPLFSYSKEGQDAGVWTDARVMILDKEISDEIYNINKQRRFLTEKRKNPNKSEKEIIKGIDEKSEGKFPNYERIIPSEDKIGKSKAKFTGNYDDDGPAKPMEYTDGETTAYLNADYIATIKSKFPDATLHLTGPMSPAVYKVGDEIKAIQMPIQRKSGAEFKKLEKARLLKLNGKYYKMSKAKEVPVGSISKDGKKKKSADGTWVPVKAGKPTPKPGEKPKPNGKPDDKKKKQEPTTDENSVKERVKTALKKMATILADALSGKDSVQPTGAAVEQAGEDIKRKKKTAIPETEKPKEKPTEKPKADKPKGKK